MNRCSVVTVSCLVVLAALFVAPPVQSADVLAGIPVVGDFGTDLHAARDNVDLVQGSTVAKTRLTRGGLTISESYGEHLALGMFGGYAAATQKGQDVTAGLDFKGGYAGVNLQAMAPLGRWVSTGITAQVLYQWLKDSTPTQEVKLEWWQGDALLDVEIHPTRFLTLYGGPTYTSISVDQTARGTVDATTNFDGRRKSGAVYGLRLEVDLHGWVTLEAREGPLKGVALSFQRRY